MTITFVSLYPSSQIFHKTTLNQSCSWVGSGNPASKYSSFRGASINRRALQRYLQHGNLQSTPRAMLSGGGFLGVGPSEVVVIVAVGWLILGPQKLLALAKDSGKLLGQLRRTADEAQETFREVVDMDLLTEEALKMESTKERTVSAEAQEATTAAIADTAEAVNEAVIRAGDDVEEDLVPSQVETPVLGEDEAPNGFLDQLRRVSDPNQMAPSEVPDLDTELDTEMELEKLEREYLKAKESLERRRVQRPDKSTNEQLREGKEEN